MSTDEQQIRELIRTWMDATKAGDIATVLSLMSDDVVFLVPGRAPMNKAEFAALSSPPTGIAAPQFDSESEIQEIKILGEWAFLWTRLRVSITPPGAAAPMMRAGHTLSVLQKQNGRWVLARDANLLAPVVAD